MKSTRIQAAKLSLILLPLLLTFGAKSAIAQITPANDGTGTIVNTQNNQLNISGGTQAGNNQFHSFQQFGLNAGQTANFLSNPNVANILGRVTGGDASLINGILKVSGSNANLFLINPSGIVFGKDASLNVPGAFTATTANGIGFGSGNWFNAIGSNNYATLTSNPTSFGFIGTSGSLVNAGNLSVNPGQSIALVGGTIVNTGTIAAPGGDITIAAIPGSKMVRIGQAGTVLSLDLPTSDKALINAPIATPLSLPALLTGGSIPTAMGVVVEDGIIKLTGGSASVNGTLNADGTGLQNGGNVVAYADNHLDFGGTIAAKGGELGGNGGFVDTSGKGSITIAPSAKVLTTAAKGLMGTWLIDPADLEVVTTGGNGTSTIGADTIVTNLNTTSVNLQADNSITVNAAIDTSLNANAGNLTLTAPIANLNQAIVLKTGSTLSGTAATVNVGATGTVQNGVDVAAANGTVKLAAATYTLAQEVGINKNVTVRGTGAGTTTVSGNNAVRVFNIASGTVTLDGMSIVNGNVTGSKGASSGFGNGGNGGDGLGGGIYNAGTLTVSNSTLSSNSSRGGGGGSGNGFSSRGGNGGGGGGGGIYNVGTLTLSNITLSGNFSSGGSGGSSSGFGSRGGNGSDGLGGGIYNAGTLTVSNSTLSSNFSNGGGGGGSDFSGLLGGFGSNFGGGIYNTGTLTIDNGTFSENSAERGGGISNSDNGTLTIGNSTFSENSARVGGGISNQNGGTLTIDNSTFSENSAQGGGGILNQNGGTLTIDNSTLSRNSARVGGGISNSDNGTLTIGNSTFSENSAEVGGGILNENGTLTIGNSIVSGNISPTGGEISLSSGTFTSQGYNLFGHSGTNGLTGVTAAATDITPTVTLNQIIGTLANNGGTTQTHALVANSPALNAGDPTSTLTIDQRGGQRGPSDLNAGTRIDIGAYEATSSAVVVNTLDTIGAGSLRAAINLTNGTYVDPITNSGFQAIRFNIGTVGSAQTIALTSALPAIVKDTTIDGWTQGIAGYNGVPLITVSGSNLFRVFEVGSGATVGMNGLAIVNGKIVSGNGGAGIFNRGTLTVTNSLVSGNSAKQGGGIQNDRTLTLSNSTLSGNSSDFGGGLLNYGNAALSNVTISGNSAGGGSGGGIDNPATLTVSNSTISGNSAGQGGGIASNGALTIGNSIVSGNTALISREIHRWNGTITSQGYNLFGHSASNGLNVTVAATDITPIAALSSLLSALGDYGGPTKTHALLPGSAAINAGNTASTLDQRGKARVGTADIGAFESQGFTFATTAGTPQNVTVDQAAATPLTVKVTANDPIEPVAGGIVDFTAPGSTSTATLSTNKATIDASGNASTIATANTKAGTYNVTASILGITPTQSFALTNVADIPNAIVTTSGSGQSTIVDNNFANNLVATVTDKFGNPVSNSTVTFSTPGTGASGTFTTNTVTTNASGVATIAIKANTKAGAFTATGKVSGVTAGADFSLTNKADVASQVTTTSGSGQSTTVNTDFTDNLVATVTDKFGNPIEGTTVTFSVPGSGQSATFTNSTATTGADGKASIATKANTKAGTYTATGTVIGIPAGADFALTNKADRPTQITTQNTAQNAIVGQSFNSALQVKVLDQYGNPVSSNAVTLTLPSSGASGVFAGGVNSIVLTTDANGMITTPLIANSTPGTYTGTIQVQGSTQLAQFTFTNDPAPIVPDAPKPEPESEPVAKPTPKTDRTLNLEAKEIRNSQPSIARPETILCVERSGASANSTMNPYQGVATCGATTTQGKAIEPQAKADR